jgi:lipopolysaccharide/colanic/teichoic acid biosynthesis glycosyltransferase
MTGDARAHAPFPRPESGHAGSASTRTGSVAPVALVGGETGMDDGFRRATSAVALASVGLPAMSPAARAAKRGLDVVGATVGLMALAPLFACVAAAIRVSDGKPALFRQRRAGLGGHPFLIVKFRTMRMGADAERAVLRAANANEVAGGAAFKMTDDPRVTRVGRYLRRTSVDELPQLWNVLRGEMSLVGPRPHPYDDLAGYAPWHYGRLAVKPGLTGLWQIRGRSEADFDRWVAYDLEYIRTRTFLGDVSIIFRTIPAMIRRTGR